MPRWIAVVVVLGFAASVQAQGQTRWLAAGDLHNWYSERGAEREEGLVRVQQYGWRWPGIYDFRDVQSSKALWMGAQNVVDENGTSYPVRVVHVGPRGAGIGETFATRLDLASRFALPIVTVDGLPSRPPANMVVDRVDPSLPADVMITNEFNTLLGLSVGRRIFQFAHDPHDDYHITEYTFTNTGNTDADAEIELPSQTLENVWIYRLARLAVARETRYVIGNPTGWGKNTMIDTRGDGVLPDPEDEDFRAQFAWHGYFPPFTPRNASYDNIGGPIMPPLPPAASTTIAPSDTLGRLGASEFAGTVTLHADTSPVDPRDDDRQPATTNWPGSDIPLMSNNTPFDVERMTEEYALMTGGHQSPRHAYAVEPSGLAGWLNPTADPSLGTPGGFSIGDGYGPYTLAPGESVRIVVAEGTGGLSREANAEIGAAFKAAGYGASVPLTYNGRTMTKNEWVFTSRDSLFQTFRRALANHASEYRIPRPPPPPRSFSVEAAPGGLRLSWTPPEDASGLAGFEIYRASGRPDSVYTRIHAASPSETTFFDEDTDGTRERYYFIQSVGRAEDNDGTGETPPGALRSSRYLTQTYRAVRPLPVASEPGAGSGPLRLHAPAPNPARGQTTVRFALDRPAEVTLSIFDVRGAEVVRLADGRSFAAGTHALDWAADVAAGVYLVRLRAGGEVRTRRVVVAR